MCKRFSQTCFCISQVRGGVNGQLFSLSNSANTNTITEGISQRGSSEVVYRFFSSLPNDIYYWVLPENFRGDKVRKTNKTTTKWVAGREQGKKSCMFKVISVFWFLCCQVRRLPLSMHWGSFGPSSQSQSRMSCDSPHSIGGVKYLSTIQFVEMLTFSKQMTILH